MHHRADAAGVVGRCEADAVGVEGRQPPRALHRPGARGPAPRYGKERRGGDSTAHRPNALAVLLALLPLLLLPALPASAADGKPAVKLSQAQAGKGGDITVSGSGWRPGTLLMMLICGQAVPDRGVIGGTNACANSDGRAVTTDAKGSFSKEMPVAEPPKPCPCVVHVATVTGEQAVVDAPFTVAGHPTAPLPQQAGAGRLAVLAAPRLEGESGILVFFGAPPSRRLEFTVGNLGSAPVRDPVFQVGTSHGVFAPQWEEQQWRGTIAPGQKAQVKLPVQLSAGAHGDYQVSVKYGTKVLVEQPWGVGRPWGVTIFWLLLAVVVPAAVFRIGMAIVDRLRPRGNGSLRPRGNGRHRTVQLPTFRRPGSRSRAQPSAAPKSTTTTTAALPWFTPDSAPSENRSTTKGHS
ncbi:hypothetical protein ACFWDI_02285 [Streptomyces sp. NPDC060064]|uniref:hypothetical protein n=1 Tax=Streptomyces sp. NPDC060064 TaxID=3347049 RepID=UPI0036C2B6FC